jgi:RNA polymerase sigma factor (sigma-70 family)
MTDKELVDGCLREERQVQELLFRRFAPRMKAVCMRYCQNQEDAEDALMETFVKVFDHIRTFSHQGALEGWIRRIAVNTSLNKIRSRRQTETLEPELHDTEIGDDALNRLETIELLEMIGKLPEGYRMVFNMYAVEGYSHHEIAGMLGIEEVTSRTQLAKARRALQKMIILQKELH